MSSVASNCEMVSGSARSYESPFKMIRKAAVLTQRVADACLERIVSVIAKSSVSDC